MIPKSLLISSLAILFVVYYFPSPIPFLSLQIIAVFSAFFINVIGWKITMGFLYFNTILGMLHPEILGVVQMIMDGLKASYVVSWFILFFVGLVVATQEVLLMHHYLKKHNYLIKMRTS